MPYDSLSVRDVRLYARVLENGGRDHHFGGHHFCHSSGYGTASSPKLAPPGSGGWTSVGVKTSYTSERDGTRTRNHRIDSPVL